MRRGACCMTLTQTFAKVRSAIMMLNELEFAYSPVREKVRDLREYL